MCEINPKHSLFFRLEAYTSNPNISKEDFEEQVRAKAFSAEVQLNKDTRFRFHIHEENAKKAKKD